MKTNFSTSWKGSSQRRKQRKYRYNAPLHTQNKFLSVSVHKTLREKYGLRTLPIRKGDKVKILRGSFKGKEALVESIDRKTSKVVLEKIRITKTDGAEVPVSIHVSNLQLVSLYLEDARRIAKHKENKKQAKIKK